MSSGVAVTRRNLGERRPASRRRPTSPVPTPCSRITGFHGSCLHQQRLRRRRPHVPRERGTGRQRPQKDVSGENRDLSQSASGARSATGLWR
jgi:hypothetical protein